MMKTKELVPFSNYQAPEAICIGLRSSGRIMEPSYNNSDDMGYGGFDGEESL